MIRRDIALKAAPVAFILAAVIAFFAFGLNQYLNVETLRANEASLRRLIAQHSVLGPLAFVAIYAAMVAISLPGAAVMTITGGFLFGLWLGASLSVLGATVGAIALFILARFVVGDSLRQRASPYLSKLAEGFERNAFSYLLFLRLIPLFPFWAINLAAAVFRMPLRTFATATLIGIIPGSLAYAAIGDGLGLAVGAGTGTQAASPMSIALRVGLALLALVPVLVKWLKARRSR